MIRGLVVFQVAKAGGLRAPARGWEWALGIPVTAPVWQLDTCQRWLLVTHGNFTLSPAKLPVGVEMFRGSEAYEFLLEVATGLASQLAGETNILGQMKAAWSGQAPQVPWLQWLFADAKEIRARHLSEVGGASYGRSVRQLLRQPGGEPAAGPVLLVGAGDMAETVAPWLRAWPLQIVNRTPARAQALAERLSAQPGAAVASVPPQHHELAWRSAGAVVVCVPADAAGDPVVMNWLRASIHGSAVPVIHLGVHRLQAGPWGTLPEFRCLDDIYELQHQADSHRDRQLALASQACAERARHRGLGSSLSHPHGWEDLPSFFPFTAFQLGGQDRSVGRRVFEPEALAA